MQRRMAPRRPAEFCASTASRGPRRGGARALPWTTKIPSTPGHLPAVGSILYGPDRRIEGVSLPCLAQRCSAASGLAKTLHRSLCRRRWPAVARARLAIRQTSRCRPHWTRRLDQKLLGPATLLGLAVCRAGEPKSQPGGHSVTLVSESELRGALRHAGISNRRPCVVDSFFDQRRRKWQRDIQFIFFRETARVSRICIFREMT